MRHFLKDLSFISKIGLTWSIRKKISNDFDQEYYLDQNPDVAESGLDPLAHYLADGWKEGRDPHPDFNTSFYLSVHDTKGTCPLLHWVLEGRDRGLATKPSESKATTADYSSAQLEKLRAEFSAEYYVRHNPDVAEAGADPFAHYLACGWAEGRNPNSDFSTLYYLDANTDIAEAGINPFAHYILHGRKEGRLGLPMDSYSVGQNSALLDPAEINWLACPAEDVRDIAKRFDDAFYLDAYREVAALGVDPKVHYLMLGWRLGYDPRPDFSTVYYCDRNIDIKQDGGNPFLHYCRYGYKEHRETQSYIEKQLKNFCPKVSVIVPNYNHAKYLPQRLRSIADQTYNNIELIILDDKSSDNSREVILELVDDLGLDARLEFNDANAGNVFKQWRKGLSLASGELIWICESDDFCEPDFLENMVTAFADESVNIAFGRIQFSDGQGNLMEGLDAYRENAEPGIWGKTITRPAAEWFRGGFGVNNVIANVGGCVFRRVDLPENIWEEVQNFKICGDWFLYLHISGAGQITYDPRAVAYFRQHGANTSASNFHQQYYYKENFRILRLLAETWGIPKKTRLHFIEKVEAQYQHHNMHETLGDFDNAFAIPELLEVKRKTKHIQIYFLGFHPGGGELFPINLANALLEAGYFVSMVAIDLTSINQDMQARLDRRIPVYHAVHLTSRGRGDFLDASGVTLINSHVAGADAFLYSLGQDRIERPYVVTLHGSYVAFEGAPRPMIEWITANVDNWIYTADRNLEFFENEYVDWGDFVKLPNAMPRDERDALFTRDDLGISESDIVFIFVARGIKRKGWRAAIEAFRILQAHYGRADVKLLMIGEGEETDRAKTLAADLPDIHFVGYQSEINGIFRLSDALVLPTRFEGESYPLCLIQAIQDSLPAIATDIGEIKSMMTAESGETTGILLENQRDSRAFFDDLAKAMNKMCDRKIRADFSKQASTRASAYEMKSLVVSYSQAYRVALEKHALAITND